MDKYQVLNDYFGYKTFRSDQGIIIDKILEGQDILAVIRTGGGKSLIFQVPALMFTGLTIVISPLISLMEDQVNHLKSLGIRADYINSNKDFYSQNITYSQVKRGFLKLLYVSPERLSSKEFVEVINKVSVSMITIDEAHCVSLWGLDFRQSYFEIKRFINSFKKRPVVSAFTATANKRVIEDILHILGLNNPFITKSSFDRKNLFYSVVSPVNKENYLVNFLEDHKNQVGIVYCVTIKECVKLYKVLKDLLYNVLLYHGQLDSQTKTNSLSIFLKKNNFIMICTNAFGMGIDKPNIRFVINYSLPLSIEDLVQQSGRASRDNLPGICILIFNYKDIYVNKYFIDNLDFLDMPKSKIIELKNIKKLQLETVVRYAKCTTCLHKFILEYFAEDSPDFCNNCSNCNSNYKEVDFYKDAINIIKFVNYTKERYGFYLILNTLSGTKNLYTTKKKLIYNKFFNSSKIDKGLLKNLLSSMINDGYLEKTSTEYPIIKLTKSSNKLIKRKKYTLKIKSEVSYPEKLVLEKISHKSRTFIKLQEFRNRKASEEKIENFMVLNSKTINELIKRKPKNLDSLYDIYGLSTKKINKYGLEIIEILKQN